MTDLRKLEAEATAAPWTTQGGFLIHGPDKGGLDIGPLLGEVYNRANGRFIAGFKNAAPLLLDVVDYWRSAASEMYLPAHDHPDVDAPCVGCDLLARLTEATKGGLALAALDAHLGRQP